MKKTYIAPVSLEHKIEPEKLIAESMSFFSDDEVNGENALTNEDYGFQDEDTDVWGSWKKTW